MLTATSGAFALRVRGTRIPARGLKPELRISGVARDPLVRGTRIPARGLKHLQTLMQNRERRLVRGTRIPARGLKRASAVAGDRAAVISQRNPNPRQGTETKIGEKMKKVIVILLLIYDTLLICFIAWIILQLLR